MIPRPLICLLTIAVLACATNGAFASGSASNQGFQVDADGRRILNESVRFFPEGSAGAGVARVIRMSLSDEEAAAPMSFSIALRMRDFAGLQARIAAGERISWSEMEEKYRPLKSDYERVAGWLATQGFEVVLQDSTHTNLFVRGSVTRVNQAFGVQMARVTAVDGEYTAAISAPRIPADLAELVLSVNGLQPQLRLRHVKYTRLNAAAWPADVVNNTAYVTPDDIAAAYHFPGTLDGTGQTIAILDEVAVQMSDLTAFWTQVGVAQKAANVTVINVVGTPGATTDSESAADVEWAGALAPGAKIRQYVSGDVFPGFASVLNDLRANPTMTVVSVSYGSPEVYMPSGYLLSYSQTLAQLAAAGVTVFASVGDGGSNSDSGTYGTYSAMAPLEVDYPASDVDVTGVGGTQLHFDANWNATGETVWSDMATTQSATGGGLSIIFQKPAWQSGGALLAGQSVRCVPDVAAISVGSAPPGGISQGNGTTATGEIHSLIVVNGQTRGFAGTSLATPIWAAIGALVNQARSAAGHGPIGLIGPNLYPLGGTSALTDITSGTNGAYSAGPGYDLCSGLGSPNVTNLVAALISATPPSTFFSPVLPVVTGSVPAPASDVKGGATVTMSVSAVSNLGPVTYQWTLNGANIPGATSATYSIVSVRGNDRGTYTVQVENDVGTVTVAMGTLSVLAPTVSITAAAPSAVMPGSSITMSVSATSSGGPLSYQWTFNGGNIPGAVQPSLTVSNIASANAGDYTVNVTDSNGLTVVDLGYLTLNGPNYLTPYSFVTLAGSGGGANAVAVDAAGNLYVADEVHNTVRKITSGGTVTTLAGIPGVAGSADGVGSAATFNLPRGIAVDSGGKVYVADAGNATIRMITPEGVVSTLAGTAGRLGSADGTGAAAQFNYPLGLATDKNGNLFVTDVNNDLVRIVRPGGVVTTLAGSPRLAGNTDGTGSAARFDLPAGVAVDASGNVYVAADDNDAIRKITPDGRVTTLAGNSGPAGRAGVIGSTDGTGQLALFAHPQGVATDSDGNVYAADTDNNTIRMITPSGVVTTLAGVPGTRGSSDGTGSAALFNIPTGLVMDVNGVLYVADSGNGTVRAGILAGAGPPLITTQPIGQTTVARQNAVFSVTAGGIPTPTYQWQRQASGSSTWTNLSDNATYSGSSTATLTVISVTAAMNGDSFQCTITNASGSVTTTPAALVVSTPLIVSTLAGQAGASGTADGAGSAARFHDPADVAVDSAGNIYVADTDNHTVRKVTPAGVVSTLAGQAGTPGSADGAGSAAGFRYPSGLTVDGAGNVYVADTDNETIRKITPAGVVTTLAGQAGISGSTDGPGSTASFKGPSGVVADAAGNLYVADTLNHTIRRVTSAGMVSTIAGAAGVSGSADGLGSAARFHGLQGLAIDATGNLYVADTNNDTIRKVVTATGAVTTVAGLAGIAGSTDGAPAQGRFYYPSGVAVDGNGNLYVADTDNHALREVSPSGAVSTIAGTAGASGTADDLGAAARFDFPSGIAVDGTGNIYTADTSNHTIRLGMFPAAPAITTQPQSQTVTAGANVQFSVSASGKPAPTYQWYFGGTAISGATGSSYSIANVQSSNAGDYTVTVSNSSGSVTSAKATLTVNAAAAPPSSSGGGGGGGGGAMEAWFVFALILMAIGRWMARVR